jgi:hypothetical protein
MPNYSITLDPHRENNGRWGTMRGVVTPRAFRVDVLVFSHDERWYVQKPALSVPTLDGKSGAFHTDVAFGLDAISPQGREYLVVALVSPEPLPHEGVYEDLNDLPPGTVLSPPRSVVRTDP